jgi:hypothetical protein
MIGFDGEGVNPDIFDADVAALTGSNGEVGATMLGIPFCDTTSITSYMHHHTTASDTATTTIGATTSSLRRRTPCIGSLSRAKKYTTLSV